MEVIILIINNFTPALFIAYSEVYCVGAASFCFHEIIRNNPHKLPWIVPFIELKWWLMQSLLIIINDAMLTSYVLYFMIMGQSQKIQIPR